MTSTSAALAKPAAPKFYPPRPKPWLVWLMHRLSGSIAHWGYRMDLEISAGDLACLKRLKGDRLVFFANHPTFGEPVLMYDLSSRLGERFYYMAAYELVSGGHAVIFPGGWVYSIRRGLVDRQSIKQTIDLLRQPASRLVIFPEGRCSFQSDRLMEFQPGGVQLAFQALSKLPQTEGQSPQLFAIPISIHYQYRGDLREIVEETLVELEEALALPAWPGIGTRAGTGTGTGAAIAPPADPLPPEARAKLPDQAYGRLRRVAQAVLQRIEADCAGWDLPLPPLDEHNWNERLEALRDGILNRCEALLGLPSNLNQPRRDRAYRIQAALADLAALAEAQPEGEAAAKAAALPTALPTALIKRSVERLLNLDTIYDGYVLENPTPERFIDTMSRFQRELFQIDQPKPKRNRRAQMKLGEPINLGDRLADYQRDRNATVDRVCQELRDRMQANLSAMVEASQSQSSGPSLPLPSPQAQHPNPINPA